MITLFIIAAGLVGLSLILMTRESASLRVADQRGITLQTLIVTAVLVLMAVAAGVVIVAITNNAQDDLEDQTTNIDSRCNEVEIFDPVVASRGAKGTNGTNGIVEGSDIGCIPVCVWTAVAADVATQSIDPDEVSFNRNAGSLGGNTVAAGDVYVFISDEDDENNVAGHTGGSNIMLVEKTISISGTNGGMFVRVAANQERCHVYDNRGNIVA